MADYLDSTKNALENIDHLKSIIASRDFMNDQRYSAQERKKVYASIFAMRLFLQIHAAAEPRSAFMPWMHPFSLYQRHQPPQAPHHVRLAAAGQVRSSP